MVGLAAAISAVAIFRQEPVPEFACTVSAGGLTLIATELKKGESAAIVIAVVGPIAADQACKAMIKHFAEKPDQVATIQLQTKTGPKPHVLSLAELLATPPPVPTAATRIRTVAELIACGRYTFATLRQASYDGLLDPPAN